MFYSCTRNIWRIWTYFDGMYYCRFSEANNLNSLGPVVRACEHGSEPSGPALFSGNFNTLQVNHDYPSCRVVWRKNRRLSKIMKWSLQIEVTHPESCFSSQNYL
jgi:hypothetical protein